MSRPATLVLLVIDALGPDLAEASGFYADRLGVRRRLRTILGYSSAAIPSLLTGKRPAGHGHWFLYFRAARRDDSPFVGASLLARLPAPLRNRWTVRRTMAEWWRKRSDIRGYFGLYEVPWRELKRLDYVERDDTWASGVFPGGSYIDDLAGGGLRAEISDWRVDDDAKLARALAREERDPAEVYLLYLSEIDARQHAHGSRGEPVFERLRSYRETVDRLLAAAARRGAVELMIVSDHGMTDIRTLLDPWPLIRSSGLKPGRDFEMFLDSTFLRFWSDRPGALARLTEVCGQAAGLSVVDDETLDREGVRFADHRYGEAFLLADPGVLICPSYMGHTPLSGMHGYTPDDAASDALLLAESEPPAGLNSILDLRAWFNARTPAAGKGSA